MEEKIAIKCEEAFDFLYTKAHANGFKVIYVDFPLRVDSLSGYFHVKHVGIPSESESVVFPGLPSGNHVYQISWD